MNNNNRVFCCIFCNYNKNNTQFFLYNDTEKLLSKFYQSTEVSYFKYSFLLAESSEFTTT